MRSSGRDNTNNLHNYALIILDSCRYDTAHVAWPDLRALPAIGPLQKGRTFATWTQPAHLNFMTGRLPWVAPEHDEGCTFRSGGKEFYDNLAKWRMRIGPGVEEIVRPDMRLEVLLKSYGFYTKAIVSARPLGPGSLFSTLFDSYVFLDNYGPSAKKCLSHLIELPSPFFVLINLTETHFPYYYGAYDPQIEEIRMYGLAAQGRAANRGRAAEKILPDIELLNLMKERQIDALRYVDSQILGILDILPDSTYVTVTSDHGELFGESGQWGHGEVTDPVIFDVPLVEGWVPLSLARILPQSCE
jgi:sulfatase-like protein